MVCKTGPIFRPRSVSEYSTVGGEVCMTFRTMTAFSSNSRKRVVKTLAETFPRSLFKSPKRRGSCCKYQMICGVQAPAKSLRLYSRGHGCGTGPDLLGLCLTITFSSFEPLYLTRVRC